MRGHTLYRDIWMAQMPPTLPFLKKVIDENNFTHIIEIGAHRGALSLWLNDNKKEGCKFTTFDIDRGHLLFSPEKENIDFREADCFTTGYEQIKDIIESPGQVLLLCDGGDKNREFITFCQFLKKGDIIMCHDYVEDFDTFRAAQIRHDWFSAPESDYGVIMESIINFKLEPYLYEEAKSNIWGSFKKS